MQRSTSLYRELVLSLDDGAIQSRLADLPSNTIGQQLWCVVGARESYLAAARNGSWAGFSCSLNATDITTGAPILAALEAADTGIATFLETWDAVDGPALGFMLDLLEHEAQHHGQLIRYLYGLRLAIPAAWKARYALD